jgi:hypothetical protein
MFRGSLGASRLVVVRLVFRAFAGGYAHRQLIQSISTILLVHYTGGRSARPSSDQATRLLSIPLFTALMNSIKSTLTSTAALVAASLAVRGYRQLLHPLYANVPTELYLPHVLYGSLALSLCIPRLSRLNALLAVGVFLCAMPHLVYWTAVYTSRLHDPVKGPFFTHVLSIPPLMFLLSRLMVSRYMHFGYQLSMTKRPGIAQRYPQSRSHGGHNSESHGS